MSSNIAVIGMEGVMAHPEPNVGDSFASQAPIQTGLKLFVALRSMYKLVLVNDEVDQAPVEHFLKQNTINGYAYLIGRHPWQETLTHAELRLAQLDALRGQLGMPVSLLVDPDPVTAARTMHKGIVAMLFAHPQYLRPEFRPDEERGVRAWDDIAAEIEAQKSLKGTDPRLVPGVGI